jgi:Holliday junction resolvase RusA-like endonuclease
MLILTIDGPVTPKARPRVARGQAYLPAGYRTWKDTAIASIQAQTLNTPGLPWPQAHVSIAIGGKQRGDLDNIAGAILDALVQAGVLADDRLACVPRLTVEHHPTGPRRATVWLDPPANPSIVQLENRTINMSPGALKCPHRP